MTRYSLTRCTLFGLSAIVALAYGCGGAADDEAAADEAAADEAAADEAAEAEERCDELRDAIVSSLQEHVDNGVLVESAAPCGANGIAKGGGSFHERLSEAEIDALQRDFAAACDEYAESCAGEW